MSKNKKIVIVLVIAVIAAILAGFGTFSLIVSQKTTIYTFNASYKAGTAITSSMLTPIQVDKRIVSEGASNDLSTVFVTAKNIENVLSSNDTLRNSVANGTILTPALLTQKGGNDIENSMKSDAVCITIGVNNITGITNDLNSGSYVNINCVSDNKCTTIECQRIIDVFKDDSGVIQTVTIECDYATQQALAIASANGKIHLALVNASGYQYNTSTNNVSSATTSTKTK